MAETAIQFLLENLKSVMTDEIRLILGVDDELEKLRSTLTTIQAVLEDAELKQTDERSNSLRDWLRKLNLLVYEIDDIMDDCNRHASKLNPFKKFLYRYNIFYRHKIGRRMKQVTAKLDGVAAERAKFHLQEMPVHRPREVAASWRETGSMLNKPVYGRDEDRDKIVKMLVDDHHVRESQHLSVLPIIGVGGLGKTTLAQLVFKDPLVVKHFEERIWVCVSDNFDIKKLVNDMIGSATGSNRASDLQLERVDDLQRRLRELLSQKRFLIVLDDVWNENQKKWFELKEILSCGSTGASIIVTTRQEKIAKIMGTLPAHCLKGLSNKYCWILFRQYAFGQEEEVNPELELIGKESVEKCAGVPLAAQALGGILRFKREEKQWTNVRDSETWKLLAEESLILPTLRLSYHHLPLELRQCFAYFAAFPKDYYIEKEELIRLWIAHGFISSKETFQMEDVGNEICNELILRSLLQQSHVNNKKIGMHDLVHDLAESVMENKVPGIQIQSDITSASTIRQVNLRERRILFPKSFQEDMDISSISKLTSLRVLDASYTKLKDLPRFISNLKHLRYLNLSHSEIRILPNSLCTLWNLKILNLDDCRMLVALPKGMRYLKNLQHLCLDSCSSLCEMPTKMRELSNLKTLSMFIVGQNKGNQLEELQYLDLCGSLEIRHLERVKEHLEAKKANIAMKKNLQKLSLWWERHSSAKLGEDDVDEKVLEALEPHSNLEKLSVKGFSGKYFSLWKRSSTMRKIVEINIVDCDNCKRLPKLGELPHLKFLQLRKVGVEYIIEEEEEVENGNPVKKIQFQALEKLELNDLPNLKGLSKEQESTEAFQNVEKLSIEGCSSLILPRLLSSFKMLKDLRCGSLNLAQSSEMDGNISLIVNVEETVTCFLMETFIKFTNLRDLRIRYAKEISWTGEDMKALNKLESFSIEGCNIKCIPEGVLRHLTSLRDLYISLCPELEELSDEIKYLRNLEVISLWNLPKMAFLPSALQHLSSLRILHLHNLPELESLPDCLHQLTSLYVGDCTKVASLPDCLHQLTSLRVQDCTKVASLPAAVPNLIHLTIDGCPELERQCKRGSGKEWHKIAHIPILRIGRQ